MINLVKKFIKEEDGMGTVEIVIIVSILIGLAFIFKKQIYGLVDQIFNRIFNEAGETTSSETVDLKQLGE